MSQTIMDGGLAPQDPSDALVYLFDWSILANLALGVTIITKTITLTRIKGDDVPALVSDQETLLAGNRTVQLRLSGGAAGSAWEVACKIVTSETPAQTKERSFRVLVQNK